MKSTSDLFNEIIPLGRLIYMVNQKKDRLLNDYLSPLDITASQFKVLCSIRCAVCITPVELKKVLSVDAPTVHDLAQMGTLVKIKQMLRLQVV